MLSIKIHQSYRTVVALADEELIGKKFEQEKFQLEIRKNFFKDKSVSKEQAIKILQLQQKNDATFNIVGKQAVETAKQAGIITDEHIAEISNIPYALTLI